jgi:polar amino acid transport system substrate-binding protein
MSALPPIATAKADIGQHHVRFTPESGHVRCNGSCLLWAKSGHRGLLHHLIVFRGDLAVRITNIWGTKMRAKRIIAALAFAVAVVSAFASHAQQTTDPRVADLVQSGKLRVALGLGSPALAMKDANTGEVRGPALDLAQALADKIGVKLELIEYPRPGAILADVKNDKWDVTFLVSDPTRLAEADFSPPYMQSDFTYLVPAGSSKRTVAEMDQPGIRISVARGDASDLRLTQILKHAELLRLDSIAAAIEMVQGGKVDGCGSARAVLLPLTDKAPGSRVLDDGFATIAWVAMVPKNKDGRITYMSDFIEAAKATGLVKQTIDRANLRGVQVASPGKVN